MNDVLPVQVGKRHCNFSDNDADLLISQRQFVKPAVEGSTGDALDDDMGLRGKIAGTETAGHVRPRYPRQDHLLHLKTDNGGRILALGNPRDFHQ